MTRQQTRRSVSVKGLTYQRIEAYVATTGGTISGFVEDTIVSNLGSPTEEDRRKFDEESAKKASALPVVTQESVQARESEPTQVDQDRRKLDEGIAKEQVSVKTSRSKPTPIAPRVETPNSEIPDELKDYIPPILLL